jgi:hypothetical protein
MKALLALQGHEALFKAARGRGSAARRKGGIPRAARGLAEHGYQRRPQTSCIGGHFTEPYEQNTQQLPGLGRSNVPQPWHS